MNFEDISNETILFYSNLNKKEHIRTPVIDNLFDSHISEKMASWLEKRFDEEEEKGIVFGMDGSKALGPDGFSTSVGVSLRMTY